MDQQIYPKVWGEELWVVNNELYCSKILTLKKWFRCSIHLHKRKDETFYVLSGKILIEIGTDSTILEQGDSVRIRPGTNHRFYGLRDSRILEVSTQHFEEDSYRRSESDCFDISDLPIELRGTIF